MTEKERIQGEIKILQSKLALLEELNRVKSPAEEAFKRVYGCYPITGVDDGSGWTFFQKGYDASFFEGCKEENKWKTVALRFGETLSSIGPCGYYEMTETIQQLKEDIALLQMKLQKLEEKSPAEEAFKRIYYRYPDKLDDEYGSAWDIFEKGYEAHQSLVDDANKIIKAVASMTNCIIEGNPPNGCSAWSEWFELFGSKGILNGLRLSSIDKKKPEPECPDEPLEYDEVEWDISETAPEVTTENSLLEAYKATFGKYPTVGSSASDFDIQSWNIFQYGFRFGCGELQSPVDDDSEETAPPKPAVSLYARLDDGFLYSRSGICKKVRGFLLDEGVIEYEDEECITFTLHKSLLDAPND